MLNTMYSYLHYCDTFLCKEIACVSHVDGNDDRGNEREIQAVLNNS